MNILSRIRDIRPRVKYMMSRIRDNRPMSVKGGLHIIYVTVSGEKGTLWWQNPFRYTDKYSTVIVVTPVE